MTNKTYTVSVLIGKRIQCIRKEKGITGDELARMLNISQQQVSRYERGINQITVDCLFKISEILNVELSELLGIEQQQVPFDYFFHYVTP